MNNALIYDTVSSILKQARLGDEYRGDFSKLLEKVWADGASTSQTIVKSVPLSDAEIAAFRTSLAATAAKTV